MQPSVQPLIHSRELELAARDFVDSRKPDLDLAARVEKYTNWDGELNEIVHYTKANIRGIEILVNVVLSDFCGDTKDIETIFNPNYKYFGVRVFTHDLYDYCTVIMYAENIFPSIRTTLLAAANIDEELISERERMSKNIAERIQSTQSEHYPRDIPKVRFGVFLNEAQRSRRKCRLNENEDGTTSLTVLRRKSLEGLHEYKYHDDPDYLYSDMENSRLSRAYNDKPRKPFYLEKGETIVNQNITDLDKEVYTKIFKPKINDYSYDWYSDPHKDRLSKFNKEPESKFYYGDINDVSRFEEDVTHKYGNISRFSAIKNQPRDYNIDKSIDSSYMDPMYQDNQIRDVASSRFSLRNIVNTERPSIQASPKDDKLLIEVAQRRPRPSNYENKQVELGRLSKISAIPNRQTAGLGRVTVFDDGPLQKVRNYRAVDDASFDNESFSNDNVRATYEPRRSKINDQEIEVRVANRQSEMPFDVKKGVDRSTYGRSTGYTFSNTAKKNTRITPEFSPQNNDFDIDMSF